VNYAKNYGISTFRISTDASLAIVVVQFEMKRKF